jgi:sugar (pentulose or hexulose) kinase
MKLNEFKAKIASGKTVMGIELGSTRIKGVLVDESNSLIASGSYDWENRLENGYWTYHLEDVWTGVQACYSRLVQNVLERYHVKLEKIEAIGISGMMHGYIVLNKEEQLLAPFRTWRNTTTGQASEELTELFQYHIPQRWSIAHLRQAILNGEDHVREISYLTTLAGYVHWKLTGQRVVGIGEASGMFPIDNTRKDYNTTMLNQFDDLVCGKNYIWKVKDILPKVLVAGEEAGRLTKEGARLLDISGTLQAGIPFCPPEGDAGTGMTATNSVAKRTGNVSAGTSVFAMIVLEREFQKIYPELDLVTTPAGELVAMVHCNNCTSDVNAWVQIFKEFTEMMGIPVDMNQLYTSLFKKALEGNADGGGLLSYCYLSGEHITGFDEGRPLFVRTPKSRFTLANFMRTNIMTTLGAIRIGMDILQEEKVQIDKILGHGGFFKTPEVGQRIMAAAMNAPVAIMKTAGEGGAWGIALLASYMTHKEANESLESFLNKHVFQAIKESIVEPDEEDMRGFHVFMERYKSGLKIEHAAIEFMNDR